MLTSVTYIALAVVTDPLLIRFVLSLGVANRENVFADVIYTLSAPLVAPFRGLFNVDAAAGAARFEYEAVSCNIGLRLNSPANNDDG